MDRASEFVQQQVQLLHSLPSFETLRADITEMRTSYAMETGEDGAQAPPDLPSEQSIKKAIKKANDAALHKMRVVHGHAGRRETVDQLASLVKPQGDVVEDAEATHDWQRLPMQWPNTTAAGAEGQDDAHTGSSDTLSGATHALSAQEVKQREAYQRLRKKVQQDHEKITQLRQETQETQRLLETVESIGAGMDTGAVAALTTAVSSAEQSINDLRTALRDPEKRAKIAARMNGTGEDGAQPEKRAKMAPAQVLRQLMEAQHDVPT